MVEEGQTKITTAETVEEVTKLAKTETLGAVLYHKAGLLVLVVKVVPVVHKCNLITTV